MNRLQRSIDNLLTTIEDLQTNQYSLAAAMTYIIREGMIDMEKCDVINSAEELLDHIYDNFSAFIILVNISGQPIALSWDEIEKMEKDGTLEAWIKSEWLEQTQAISIPGSDFD